MDCFEFWSLLMTEYLVGSSSTPWFAYFLRAQILTALDHDFVGVQCRLVLLVFFGCEMRKQTLVYIIGFQGLFSIQSCFYLLINLLKFIRLLLRLITWYLTSEIVFTTLIVLILLFSSLWYFIGNLECFHSIDVLDLESRRN